MSRVDVGSVGSSVGSIRRLHRPTPAGRRPVWAGRRVTANVDSCASWLSRAAWLTWKIQRT
ncbi:hypothetical protein DDV98_08195 [Streptomyces sp. IB2014 011-12]|nr:hypothetical protein DDV98_08195 [Streptomyces sp. IB2014 011-12]